MIVDNANNKTKKSFLAESSKELFQFKANKLTMGQYENTKPL